MHYAYRELDGYTYHISSEPTAYLREWLGKEWAQDATEDPDQPWTPEWLNDVRALEFRLEEIDMDAVRLREELMGHKADGYSFEEELESRVEERMGPVQMGTSVMPLVIRGRDMELMDGYTRYVTLKRLGATRMFAYVGR